MKGNSQKVAGATGPLGVRSGTQGRLQSQTSGALDEHSEDGGRFEGRCAQDRYFAISLLSLSNM